MNNATMLELLQGFRYLTDDRYPQFIVSDEEPEADNVIWLEPVPKTANTITLESEDIVLDSTNLSQDIEVERFGAGNISAVSNDTDIATVSVDDNIVTITAVGVGTTTVTINVAEDNDYLAGTATVSVTVESVE